MTQGYPDPQVYDTTPKLLKYNAEQFPDDVALRQKNLVFGKNLPGRSFINGCGI
jgi:long-chain acyl-CoA synthetase